MIGSIVADTKSRDSQDMRVINDTTGSIVKRSKAESNTLNRN